jgi:hypothetical protein
MPLHDPRLTTGMRAATILAFVMVTPSIDMGDTAGVSLIAVLVTGGLLHLAALLRFWTRSIGRLMLWIDVVALGLLLHQSGGEESPLLPVVMV